MPTFCCFAANDFQRHCTEMSALGIEQFMILIDFNCLRVAFFLDREKTL